ncbi:MAG: hypothetical protein SNJ70_03510 [Armatimonadota bacterium]
MKNFLENFAILVNSTDSFEDCWQPFFKLFNTFWQNCEVPIYLNTESKEFSYPNLNIICTKVGNNYRKKGRPPWGWCLIECLKSIEEDYILYLQEDYFVYDNINTEILYQLIDILSNVSWSHQDCSHIGLTHFGSHSPFHLTEFPMLWEIDRNANYRLSLQAGLWKKESLIKYINERDTGWNFEEIGSKRSRQYKERFLTVNRHIFNPNNELIIPYIHTGIIRGKWNEEAVVELFKQHNIEVDYSIRGFYDSSSIRKPQLSFVQRKIRNLTYKVKRALNKSIDSFRDY